MGIQDSYPREHKIFAPRLLNAAVIDVAASLPVSLAGLTPSSIGVFDVGEAYTNFAMFVNGFSDAAKTIKVLVVGVPESGLSVRLELLTFTSDAVNTDNGSGIYACAAQTLALRGFRYLYFIPTEISSGEAVNLYGWGY